ncbi:MAG: T9SS type A sorting domain-containing protein [Bacteroidetes bacterium]|nr:T9SS type A sorting domain-containing protein [Bacteroidota bacterium]
MQGDDLEQFQWESAGPQAMYRIHFLDAADTAREIILDSDDGGTFRALSITHQQLGDLIDNVTGTPGTQELDLIWFVEAYSGPDTIRSNRVVPDAQGFRLKIKYGTMLNTKGVALVFPSSDPVNLTAGDELQFELRGMDGNSIKLNWDIVGSDVTLLVHSTSANGDTSARSWSADPDGYSWSRLTIAGQVIAPSAANEYTIKKELFFVGRAMATYRSSKAERNVTFSIVPRLQGLTQVSPPVSWGSDALDNYLVDLTRPDPAASNVYLHRPFEVELVPRDRFLNPIETATPITLRAEYPNELDTVPGNGPNPFDPKLAISKKQQVTLIPRIPRDASQPQWLEARHPTDAGIKGRSESFAVLLHAPLPFSLLTPDDSTEMFLYDLTAFNTFTWQRPDPADPYTNMRTSRFPSRVASDTLKYMIRFVDASSLTRAVDFSSDGQGALPIFTASHSDLAGVIDILSGMPAAQIQDVVWYVEATDGIQVTQSELSTSTRPGRLLRLTKSFGTSVGYGPPSGLQLAQNYPNPFNPSTTIRFATTRIGYVSLNVYDLLGSEVETIHHGMLEADEHTVTFDASALRSGVYVYRLIAEGRTISRRMVVMK